MNENVASRLREARRRAGYMTAKEAATAMGVAVSTYIQHENGGRGLSQKRAERYGRFFGIPPEFLLWGNDQPWPDQSPEDAEAARKRHLKGLRWVPVFGEARSGAWAEIAIQEAETMTPVAMQGYEDTSLFAFLMGDESMDKHYPPGSVLVFGNATEIGVREGDHVVARRRQDGRMETIVREIVREKGGLALWPRSHSAEFQTPLRTSRGDPEPDSVAIFGVLLASFTVRPRPKTPIVGL